MKFMDKLERRFGHIAIKGLMTYIVGLNAFVFILMKVDPTGAFINKLVLHWGMVRRGEIWRLFTYIFIPPSSSPFFIIFALYFYYMLGTALEQYWGSFKFNIYYLVGMIATTVVSIMSGASATATYLNLSLFLAFAHIYPDYQILLFFILPIKMKYLSWFYLASIAYTVLTAPFGAKIIALVSLANYFIFFGKEIILNTKKNRQLYNHRKTYRTQIPLDYTMHKCTICGITEKDDPNIIFRYCADCDGDYEYCIEHLKIHTHVKKDNNI